MLQSFMELLAAASACTTFTMVTPEMKNRTSVANEERERDYNKQREIDIETDREADESREP